MSHTDLRLALGAYVLGALEPAEHAEVAAHLEDCAACRAEVADFAPLPGLLGRLTPAEATADVSVPDLPFAAQDVRITRSGTLFSQALDGVVQYLSESNVGFRLSLEARHTGAPGAAKDPAVSPLGLTGAGAQARWSFPLMAALTYDF